MRSLLRVALLLSLVHLCSAEEPWQVKVRGEQPGPFPLIRPFTGEFRFGWSNIEVASARAKFTSDKTSLFVEVEGGTIGLARTLWQLGATHEVTIFKKDLRPAAFHQVESYATRTTTTDAIFKPSGLWYLRRVTPSTTAPEWQRLKAEPMRDIVSALLFIRSQRLRDGDTVAVAAFPGNAPYFLNATVTGREDIRTVEGQRRAIRLDFEIQRIDPKNQLLPYGKFRHGAVWLSDDENRIPLRAEVDIFIGYVYGELKSLSMNPKN